jgi:serine/threonine protein kinase
VIELAWDPHLQRKVAIKVTHARTPEEFPALSRLAMEGTILAGIDHRHLARIYDSGQAQGRQYLVMEYLPGETLAHFAQQHHAQQRRLGAGQVRRIMLEVASGLQAAHQQGVLHLDLKPENVMMLPDGTCKLIDFGLGWSLRGGTHLSLPLIAGTQKYMAPEQASGDSSTWNAATDVFGLGGLLQFLLSDPTAKGEHSPGPRHWPGLLLHRLSLRSRLHAIARQAMLHDPAARYPDPESFRKALLQTSRWRQRCLGTLCLLAGAILMGLAIDPTPIVSAQSPQTATSPARPPPQEKNFQIHLSVLTAGSQPPRVALWSAQLGWQPVQGLSATETRPDGAVCWVLGQTGQPLAGIIDGNLLAFAIWPPESDAPSNRSALPSSTLSQTRPPRQPADGLWPLHTSEIPRELAESPILQAELKQLHRQLARRPGWAQGFVADLSAFSITPCWDLHLDMTTAED